MGTKRGGEAVCRQLVSKIRDYWRKEVGLKDKRKRRSVPTCESRKMKRIQESSSPPRKRGEVIDGNQLGEKKVAVGIRGRTGTKGKNRFIFTSLPWGGNVVDTRGVDFVTGKYRRDTV